MGGFFGGLGTFGGVLGGLEGIGSLVGMFDADAERRKAEQQRQQAITDYAGSFDKQYGDILNRNAYGLQQMTGLTGDLLGRSGAQMGNAMANAGVYDSSATAGALRQVGLDRGMALSNQAAQDYFNANQFWNQGQGNLASMKLGVAGQNWGQSIADQGGAANGLQSFLQSMTQANLGATGANAQKTNGAGMMNGTGGGWAMNMPGNAYGGLMGASQQGINPWPGGMGLPGNSSGGYDFGLGGRAAAPSLDPSSSLALFRRSPYTMGGMSMGL